MDTFTYLSQVVQRWQLNLPMPGSGESQLDNIFSVVFMIAAGIAVIVVIIGGISYILSTGDPQKAAKAKNTILYALVGLAVAVSANVIVGFIFGRL